MHYLNFTFPFLLSCTTCGILIFLNHFFGFGSDKITGVQKFHLTSTSRLGGVGILAALLFSSVLPLNSDSSTHLLLQLLLVALPVFFAGTLEDLTHKITPSFRLILSLVSSTFAYLLLDVKVIRTDVWIVDWLLQWPVLIYFFSILIISGFTQAINIIDGFNGLASGQILLMLCFLSYLNYSTYQYDLLLVSLTLLSVTMGFFVLNWPFGKIFLGDGGAYLLGFCVVCLGLILISRSSVVSPFAPIMLGLYPLVEVLFSMYRRFILKGHSITQPDASHLHSLIFRRIVKVKLSSRKKPKLLNSSVAYFFWVSTSIMGGLTCVFYKDTSILLFLFFIYIFFYIRLFIQLIRFKSPRLIDFLYKI